MAALRAGAARQAGCQLAAMREHLRSNTNREHLMTEREKIDALLDFAADAADQELMAECQAALFGDDTDAWRACVSAYDQYSADGWQ